MKLIIKRIKKCSQAINYIFCKDSVIHWNIQCHPDDPECKNTLLKQTDRCSSSQ